MDPRLKWLAALAAVTVLATCCYVWVPSRGEGKVAVEFVEVVNSAPFPAQRMVGGKWVPITNWYTAPMLQITNGTRTAIWGSYAIENGTNDARPSQPWQGRPVCYYELNLAPSQSTNVYWDQPFSNFHNEQNYWRLRFTFGPDTKLRRWREQVATSAGPRWQRLAMLLRPTFQRADGPLMWNRHPVPPTNSPSSPH